MSLAIPLLLCLITLAVAYLHKNRKPAIRVITAEPIAESVSELEAMLDDLRTRRDKTRRKLLLRGEVIELKDVQVICEKGHRHKFQRFKRSGSVAQTHSMMATRNLANFDVSGGYDGPAVFGRQPGEGLGWVSASFGCPTCDALRFSFADFKHNDYTTCGNHLVRSGLDECPLCAELARSSREEMIILAKLQRAQFPQLKAS